MPLFPYTLPPPNRGSMPSSVGDLKSRFLGSLEGFLLTAPVYYAAPPLEFEPQDAGPAQAATGPAPDPASVASDSGSVRAGSASSQKAIATRKARYGSTTMKKDTQKQMANKGFKVDNGMTPRDERRNYRRAKRNS